MRRYTNEDGWTLTETLVVMIMVSVLIALTAPGMIGLIGGAKTDAAKIQMSNIETALDLYAISVGSFPDDLDALITKPEDTDRWLGPYLRKADGILDPWGNEYIYTYPGEHERYDLESLGADALEGGDDEDQDVTNWE